jgi:RecJ-like exonuclease
MPEITFPTQDGGEMTIPARYEVCDRCHGEGKHVNPAIDGNGITASEMDELGDDFREDYIAGVYDVACEECRGNRVVPVPDDDRCTEEQLREHYAWAYEERMYQRELEMERRYGA